MRLVYCPFGSREEAEKVARETVEQRLAACANILGDIRSVYPWKGVVETASETPVLFKTDAAHLDALMRAITDLHSYDVPAIVGLTVEQCPPEFATWVSQQLGDA